MTKFRTTMVALVIVMGAAFANAKGVSGDSEVKVLAGNKAGVYNLFFESAEDKTVNVRVLDANHKLLSNKRITKTDGFLQPIDFSNLPSGNYFIEINGEGTALTESIQHHVTTVKADDFTVTTVSNARKVAFATTLTEPAPLNLYFYNEAGEVVYRESVASSQLNRKLYDFSSIEGESVTVSIAHKGNTIMNKVINF
ncbi:MAG: hypothetical protein RIC80_01810 [Cyclobacteriaceae bacterium]